jgi:hypothetical protein
MVALEESTMSLQKLTLEIDGVEVEQDSPAIFEWQDRSNGFRRLLVSVPVDKPDLLQRLSEALPPPYYVLYILHTPRGEGEPGRYQSTELTRPELDAFLARLQTYFAGDARHDLWVYSPESRRTLIWDRHNLMFVEGEPFEDIINILLSLGFSEHLLTPIETHCHHYRAAFDKDAVAVLEAFDWLQTPLRPEDEQILAELAPSED